MQEVITDKIISEMGVMMVTRANLGNVSLLAHLFSELANSKYQIKAEKTIYHRVKSTALSPVF